jgi:molybdenum cofactor biosynthesis enzyme MoaA
MKKYCIQPFNNIKIDVHNGKQRYRPCCRYFTKNTEYSIDDYLASPEIKELQNHLLTQDELPAGCDSCRQQESHGGEMSVRLRHLTEKVYTEFNIETLEILPSNVCNLQCIMCGPESSSAITTEYKRLGWIKDSVAPYENNRILEDLQRFTNLKTVTMIGGEFFLDKKNLEILDFLIENKVGAKVITNATIITDRHLEKLKQVSELEVMISIDGIGKICEFIRYPVNWNEVNLNIARLKKELPHAFIHFNSVIQPLNIQYIDQLIDYANKKVIPVNLSLITSPDWLTWEILSHDELEFIVEDIKNKTSKIKITKNQKKEIESLIDKITSTKSNEMLRAKFIQKVSQLMRLRRIGTDDITEVFGGLSVLSKNIIKEINYE